MTNWIISLLWFSFIFPSFVYPVDSAPLPYLLTTFRITIVAAWLRNLLSSSARDSGQLSIFLNCFGSMRMINQCKNIHSLKCGYNCDIQKALSTFIHHSIDGDWNLGLLFQNDDITSFRGSLKVLICWSNHRFSTKFHRHKILYRLRIKNAWT